MTIPCRRIYGSLSFALASRWVAGGGVDPAAVSHRTIATVAGFVRYRPELVASSGLVVDMNRHLARKLTRAVISVTGNEDASISILARSELVL